MPDLAPAESGDFYFVDAADAEEGVRKLLAVVQARIPKRFGLWTPYETSRCSAR
jgi:exodeoxyribonuclease V alpha subunit